MTINSTRLRMAKQCFTATNIILISDEGVLGVHKIPADLYARYCLRIVHRMYANAVKRRKTELNRRKK